VLPAEDDQSLLFKELLNKYVVLTWLKFNYHKSSLIPINLSAQEAEHMAMVFYCNLGSMPFTYLGFPMGTTKPTVRDFSLIIDKIERRLSTIVSFLSYGDSLILVNSVLSSLPTYFMCTLVIPLGVIEIIDKARRRCLWRKDKNKERVNSLAAWSMICKTKEKGGMGIINLHLQNRPLLLKHLDKFYNNVMFHG
jgi:hypothetical protein